MQFRVHRFAQMQVAQWYFFVFVLKTTFSSAAAAS
jgi:hypothetical protein